MNIMKREFKTNLKPLIIWILSLSLVFLASSSEFGAFRDNPEILDAMDSFEVMFDMLGGSYANMTTPEGFVSLMSIYLYLPATIYGALLGSSIISKEERDKTAEYLFTLPIKRRQVLKSKIIVAFLYQLVFVILTIGVCILGFYRFNLNRSFYEFMGYLFISLLFISLIFMSIGMFLASIFKHYKTSGSVTLGILLGTYMLSMLIRMVDELDFLKYFIPFHYFEVSEMLEGNIEFVFVLLSVLIIGSCITGVFVFYEKRDLYI